MLEIDQYFLLEQLVEAANYNNALKYIECSSLDQYSLIEQLLYSEYNTFTD